jgi:hypothetical protein
MDGKAIFNAETPRNDKKKSASRRLGFLNFVSRRSIRIALSFGSDQASRKTFDFLKRKRKLPVGGDIIF